MVDTLIEIVFNRLGMFFVFVVNHKKTVTLAALMSLIAFAGIRIWTNYTLIDITVSQPKNTPKAELFIVGDNSNISIGNAGLHLIKRSDNNIIIRAGNNLRSQTIVSVPWNTFYASKNIDLQRDKNAEKIAYRSSLDNPCGVFSKKLNRLLQYACNNTNALTYYDTPEQGDWSVQTVANDFSFQGSPPTPYMGGILGSYFQAGTDTIPTDQLLAISDSGKQRPLQQPDTLDTQDLYGAAIVTDQHNQDNNRFVIVTKTGVIYLATPKSGPNDPGVDYIEIAPPKNYKPNEQYTTCVLREDIATCYRGLSFDSEDAKKVTVKGVSEITKLNFTDKSTVTTFLDNDIAVKSLAETNDGQLYGLSHGRLLYFEQRNGKYQPVELSRDASNIIGNDKLYFLQDGSTFVVDPKTHETQQVFYSHNISQQQLIIAGEGIIVIGKSVNSNTYTYAWKLNKDDDINYGNRLIDILPSFPASSAYGTTDLVGNMIYIETSVARDATASDIRRKKQDTLGYLKDLGVNLDQVTITNF